MDDNKKQKKRNIWPIKAFLIALSLGLVFGLFNQLALSGANLIIAFVALFVFIALAVFFDIISVAVTVCDVTPFLSMASKKVKGAKISIKLIASADRVASICGDIIGDICAIISGGVGVTIFSYFANQAVGFMQLFVPILISSLIAAATVAAKAVAKTFSIKKSQKIVARLGKFLSVFSKK